MSVNYSRLVYGVLCEAFKEFGRPTPENSADIAAWVKTRVEEIKAVHGPGEGEAEMRKQQREWQRAPESWFEKESGE